MYRNLSANITGVVFLFLSVLKLLQSRFSSSGNNQRGFNQVILGREATGMFLSWLKDAELASGTPTKLIFSGSVGLQLRDAPPAQPVLHPDVRRLTKRLVCEK